jgi:hypothetical protein
MGATAIPRTPEEFQLWMVEKVGEIQTSQETIHGDIRVAISNHEALKDRVVKIEDAAKSAKNWENGKFLVTYLIQGLIMIFRGGAHHGA